MLIQNGATAIASGGSAFPKTMEIFAEGAVFLRPQSFFSANAPGGRVSPYKLAQIHDTFSFFTTLRHSATRRLHASWQSSGTVAGGVDPGESRAEA